MIDKRLLLWTWVSPYSPTGSPDVLRKLIRHFKADNVCYVYGSREEKPVNFNDKIEIVCLSALNIFDRLPVDFIRIFFLLSLKIPIMVLYGVYKVLRFKPDAILTLYLTPEYIYSSYFLSKITGKPLFYYCHDPFLEKYRDATRLWKLLATRIEKKTMTYGNVIVLYESLGNLYREKYKIKTHLLPHIADQKPAPIRVPNNTPEFTIGFAGSVYFNNINLMAQLVSVTRDIKDVKLKFWGHIYDSVLKQIGADSHPSFEMGYQTDYDLLINDLSQCDLLYLPLSFE